ncbi:MAG: hypothetical protein FWG45_06895 [Oscillospiraceae bacterium]|nr:hypothetical protein [Oscillospiraceae bacterium]
MAKRVLQIAAIAVGIALVMLGLARGEQGEIGQKGSMVCLECIGIG